MGTSFRIDRQKPAHAEFFADVTLDWAHGRCAWFALAAAARLNLDVALFRNEGGDPVHVACITQSGLFDAYGLGTERDILASFHNLGATSPMRMSPSTAQEVREAFELVGEEHEDDIRDAFEVCERVMGFLEIEIGMLAVSIPLRARKIRP